jgi:hypothetical protein
VSEEKNGKQAAWTQRLDVDTAPRIHTFAAQPYDVNGHRWSGRQPFLDQQTQGPLTGVHCVLLGLHLRRALACIFRYQTERRNIAAARLCQVRSIERADVDGIFSSH